jgi:hypothetical protein
VHHLDYFDILAILLGILFTVAKLDAQGRKPEDFAHVPRANFERWQSWTTRIYRLGSSVCFLRVLFHQGWALYIGRQALTSPAAPRALMYPALIMDVAFLGVLVATFVRAGRARAYRRELGIVLAPLTPQQARAHVDDSGAPEPTKEE